VACVRCPYCEADDDKVVDSRSLETDGGHTVVGAPLRTRGDGRQVRQQQQRHDQSEIGGIEEMALAVA
jgi:transcriptional regulator NrdR family protein